MSKKNNWLVTELNNSSKYDPSDCLLLLNIHRFVFIYMKINCIKY